MNTKYEFTGETKIVYGRTLRRIKAIVAIGSTVVPGDIGGWIESENNLSVSGNAWVYDGARVYGNACVYGGARVSGGARVYGNAWVYDDVRVYGNAWVYDDVRVSGNACVYGNACVSGYAWVSGNACVCGNADYMTFKNSWSSGRWFTYTASNKKWKVGCFYGTGDELVRKAYSDSELSGKCYEAIVRAVETIEAAKGRGVK